MSSEIDLNSKLNTLIEKAINSFDQPGGAKLKISQSVVSVVSPIHRGVESACFDAVVDEKKYFLKIRYPDMNEFFNAGLVYEFSSKCSELLISPVLLQSLPTDGIYLYEYLNENWRWGKVNDFENKELLASAIQIKKKLHNSSLTGPGQSVFDVIEDYFSRVEKQKLIVPKNLTKVLGCVRQASLAIKASGISFKPCHGDGVASNVLINTNGLVKLVDFDSSGYFDPYYDLGSFIAEVAEFPDTARTVLEIYNGRCKESELNRCLLYAIADDLKWSLWGFICFKNSPRKEVEFVKYAEWRLLRSLWKIKSLDFEKLLHNA